MSKKIVITGGAGFIGSNLAEALAEENEVIVIDDLSTGRLENLAGIDVRLIQGSVTDPMLLKMAFEGVDYVFHLAAIASVQRSVEDPIRSNEVNLHGTLDILVAARDAGVRRVVFASSSAVYGDSPNLPLREDMIPNPKSPYAVTKLTGEHYARVFQELYGLSTVSLRFFNVFGPRQDPGSEYSGVISRFISAVLKGDQPVIYGDGEQTRDFIYVADVVRAIILAGGSRSTGVFNVASGKSTSLNQLAKMAGDAVGREVTPRHADPRPGDIRHSLADVSRARELGYFPEWSVEQGLKKTVNYYKNVIHK